MRRMPLPGHPLRGAAEAKGKAGGKAPFQIWEDQPHHWHGIPLLL